MVTVKYTSKLRRDLGRERELVSAASVAELMTELSRRHGQAFQSSLPYLRVFINGSSAAGLDGPKTALRSGDEVLLLLPVAGG